MCYLLGSFLIFLFGVFNFFLGGKFFVVFRFFRMLVIVFREFFRLFFVVEVDFLFRKRVVRLNIEVVSFFRGLILILEVSYFSSDFCLFGV